MDLLTIIVADPSQTTGPALLQKLQSELSRIHKEEVIVGLSCEHRAGHSRIVIAGDALVPPGWHDRLIRQTSRVIADFMITNEEIPQVRRLIRHELFDMGEEEWSIIEGYCRQFLFADEELGLNIEEAKQYRIAMVADELQKYLAESAYLDVEGFMMFRLPEYRNELREVIQYALGEYQLDKQYQEFISLLQYFVYIQEVKVPSVHLLHDGNNDFNILNSQLQPISTEDIDASITVEVLNHNTYFEDVLVSTLITISPRQVFIHSAETGLPIIQTISQIFEGRVQICHGCPLCQSHARRSE